MAETLRLGNFVQPPVLLNIVASKVDTSSITARELDQFYEQLIHSVWAEFTSSWERDIFNDVDAIISPTYPQSLSEAIALSNKVDGILKETIEPQFTCNEIVRLAASQQDRPLLMHLLCFAYLIVMEGVYDQVVRFLYAQHLGLAITNAEVKDIVDRFARDQIGISVIQAWKQTVRNAIGHATYFFELQTEAIRFEDRRHNRVETLSFTAFRELVGKATTVGTALMVVLILRVLVRMNFDETKRVLRLL